MWWAPNNASRWQMGFNLAFEGLMLKVVIMTESIALGYIFVSNFLFGLFYRSLIQNMAACFRNTLYVYIYIYIYIYIYVCVCVCEVKSYLTWRVAKCNKVKWNEAKWSAQYREGRGGQVFMEKVYRSSKWWEVKDWGESVSELMIEKKTITINWTQYCLTWVFLPSVHVVKF